MPYKDQFPIFDHHRDLIYLDHAATAQKPKAVLAAMEAFMEKENGSPHRGAHGLSVAATRAYDEARIATASFIGASKEEIIFTKNTTESINLVAESFVKTFIKPHQNIVLAITNHHSNILPFQKIAQETGASLRYLYVDEKGIIPISELKKIDRDTFFVSVPYIANALGTKHKVDLIREKAHEVGAKLLIDAAQALGHLPVEVTDLDPDFLVFSGHKMYGPQGIGVLYGKKDLLEKMPPFLRGGDMIEYVTEQDASFAPLPMKFEAGTQYVTGAVGLHAAILWIQDVGLENIRAHEEAITSYALRQLQEVPFIRVHGPSALSDRGALISFSVEGVHPHDVASLLDEVHIAIRAGHHCAQPLMAYMKTPATCRASFSIFTEEKDIDAMIDQLYAIKEVFTLE